MSDKTMPVHDAMQMLDDLNAKHENLRAAVEAKLKRYEEREPLVQALLAAWESRHGLMRDVAEVVPIDRAAIAVRDFKVTDDDEACGSMSST